jgi:hypothetical protein
VPDGSQWLASGTLYSKTCSFQVKTGLLHPLILKQMRQPRFQFKMGDAFYRMLAYMASRMFARVW